MLWINVCMSHPQRQKNDLCPRFSAIVSFTQRACWL
jgi:hypothetical protein